MPPRRHRLAWAAVAACLALSCTAVAQEPFPSRPIPEAAIKENRLLRHHQHRQLDLECRQHQLRQELLQVRHQVLVHLVHPEYH